MITFKTLLWDILAWNTCVTSDLLDVCHCGLQCPGCTYCSYGPQWADVGCPGNRVSLQVRATIVAGQAVTR